ncbi:unnamed protein product [Larinioides sclopetarius]|uniref:exodeoxyribonuclease III n=1 Tax=Larinioides sclopetarius TaxID=280406 RepID=A0AAV1Z7R4_9ARAC
MKYLRPLKKGIYTFGTWNIRGLNDPRKKREVFNEIERENLDVVVLTETKLKGSGQEETLKYRHIFNGVKAGPARAGVSILINKNLGRFEKVECEESGFNTLLSQEFGEKETTNERIITGKLNIQEREVIIIGVYWVNETEDRKIKEGFQNKFRDELNKWKEHELIILGDFNSKVGISTENKVVGNFGDKEINDNGRKLIKICEDFGLKIQNTFFDHEDIHKYTWYHKRNSSKSLIDYCITRQDTTLHVHDVLACRWLECGTDHILIEATISFLSEQLPTSESREYAVKDDVIEMRKYRTYLLYSKSFRDSYNKYLDSVINMSTERSTQEKYNNLKENIHSVAYDVLGIQDKNMFGEFFWDKEIKDLRRKRGLPYKTTFESNCGKIQNKVWEGVCQAIDKVERNKRGEAALQVFYQMLNMENKNAEFRPLGTWENFNYDNKKEVPKKYKIDPDKTLQINVTDVAKALYELEDDVTWPVPGGITIQLLRNCSDKTKLLLTDLIQDIFRGKEMPSEIGEIFEIGDPPLLITHCIMRIMCFILKEKTENEIGENAFILPQLNHLEAIFTLRLQLQKNAKRNRHVVFKNLKKVYLNVQYSKLLEILAEKYKISETLLAVLEKLIKSNTLKVFYPNLLISKYPLFKGLVEQRNLGPALFNLYIQECIEEYINDLKIETSTCLHMISNNNLTVVSADCHFLEDILKALCVKCTFDLKLIIKEQDLNYFGNGTLRQFLFEIQGKNVINFDSSLLELGGSSREEVYSRITTTKDVIAHLHPVLRDKSISRVVKSKIFNTIIKSILMDGCETWTLTRRMERSINSLEKYYWKWCSPSNIFLANLKLGKLTYFKEVEKRSKGKLTNQLLTMKVLNGAEKKEG